MDIRGLDANTLYMASQIYHINRDNKDERKAFLNIDGVVWDSRAMGKPKLSEEDCRYYVNNVTPNSRCSLVRERDWDVSSTYDKILFNTCALYLLRFDLLNQQQATDLWKRDVSQRLDTESQRVNTALQTLNEAFTEQLTTWQSKSQAQQDNLGKDIKTIDSALRTVIENAVARLDLKDQEIDTFLHLMNQSFYGALTSARNTSNAQLQNITSRLDTRVQRVETHLSVKNEPSLTLPFLMTAAFTGLAGVKLSTHWVPLDDAKTASGCFVPQKNLIMAYGMYAISTLALEQAAWNTVAPLVPNTATDFSHGSVLLVSAAALYGLHQSGERVTHYVNSKALIGSIGLAGAYVLWGWFFPFGDAAPSALQ